MNTVKPTSPVAGSVIALDIGNVSMKLTFDGMYRRLDVDPADSAAVAGLWEHGAALDYYV